MNLDLTNSIGEDVEKSKIDSLIKIAEEAGDSIMKIYETDFDHEKKKDNSPLTVADLASNKIICESLKNLTPKIPILSEENSYIPFEERSLWNEYWLIDPLDGTKEFINKNGEFTVNIALIRNHEPIFGLIYAPALHKIFWGCKDHGSFMKSSKDKAKELFTSKQANKPIRVVSSRSHKSKDLSEFLNNLDDYIEDSLGSSLKLCLVASGEADLYPRFGKTSEWDIAAGHAIIKFAGGLITDMMGKDIKYNLKEDLINPNFFAACTLSLVKEIVREAKLFS